MGWNTLHCIEVVVDVMVLGFIKLLEESLYHNVDDMHQTSDLSIVRMKSKSI